MLKAIIAYLVCVSIVGGVVFYIGSVVGVLLA